MVRSLDLQDNFSKTQAVERIAQIDKQKPQNDQGQFAQTMQQAALQEETTAEPMREQDQVELNSEEEESSAERKERDDKKRKKKKEEKVQRRSEHIIDIKV